MVVPLAPKMVNKNLHVIEPKFNSGALPIKFIQLRMCRHCIVHYLVLLWWITTQSLPKRRCQCPAVGILTFDKYHTSNSHIVDVQNGLVDILCSFCSYINLLLICFVQKSKIIKKLMAFLVRKSATPENAAVLPTFLFLLTTNTHEFFETL